MSISCQFAAAGTFGHECGATAETVLVMQMSDETKINLRCMGAKIPEDGLSRAARCKDHKGLREIGNGTVIREEKVIA